MIRDRVVVNLPIAMLLLSGPAYAQGSAEFEQLHRQRLPLPPERLDHKSNASLNLGPIFQLKLSRDERQPGASVITKHNQGISLRDALVQTLQFNLPIRISRESWRYQRYQLFTQLAAFVPSFSTAFNVTQSRIQPNLMARSKVYTVEVSYPVFEGGSVLYNALAQFYRDRGW